MSDWKFSHVIEISIVVLSFLAPTIIALAILYLVGIAFNELSQIGSGTGSQLILASSILGIGVLACIEIRLMRWLKNLGRCRATSWVRRSPELWDYVLSEEP